MLLVSSAGVGQTRGRESAVVLLFHIKPAAHVFNAGADIVLEFTLKNVSKRRVLATREASLRDIIYLELFDKQGRKIPWQGKISSRQYPSDFFVVLEPSQSATFHSVVSASNGSGFEIKKAGKYRVRAEFSLSPKEYFAPVSDGGVVPDRPVKSNWAYFSIVANSHSR
jgi:hypothetical protein